MAVRDALLALLQEGPCYGYQLKAQFEAATGNAWPLNIGQVYTTLQRLERDGCVAASGSADENGRQPYELTPAGRADVAGWFASTTAPSEGTRDEATMKVLLAVARADLAAAEVVRAERVAAMEHLQQVTARKSQPFDSLAEQLHLDRTVLLADARVRWLDLVEQRLEAHDGHGTQSTRHRPAARQQPQNATSPSSKEHSP